MFDAIFAHVDDPPPTPVAGNPERVVKWLKHHVREPLDTYFAYRGRLGSGHQGIRTCSRIHGQYLAEPLADIPVLQITAARLRREARREALFGEKGHEGSDSIGTLHVAHWVPFEHNHLGFFTIYDGYFEKYFQDFADKTSSVFDALFPHVVGRRRPRSQRTPRRSISGDWTTTTRRSGSTAPIQVSRFKTSARCWPIARRNRPPS